MVEGAPHIPAEAPSESAEKDDKSDEKDKKKKAERSWLSEVVKKRETRPEPEKPAERPRRSWLAEAEPTSEAKAPLERLGDEEAKLVTQETAEQRLEALPDRAAELAPEDLAAELAAREFLEAVAESGDTQASLEATAAKLEVEPATLAEMLDDESTEPEVEAEAKSESTGMPEEALMFDRHADADAEQENEFGDTVVTATISSTGPTVAIPQVGAGGRRGSGSSPPPPSPPGGQFGPPPFGPNGPGAFNPNLMPAASTPQAEQYTPQYHEASPAAMALFGGIIGYLIGRRRGRIKTEKRLLPIQHKLEKEVTDLQFELGQKEKKIRRIAAEKVRQTGPAIIEKLQPAETRRKAPEAKILHEPKAPERLGHVLVAAEAERNKNPEAGQTRPDEKLLEHLTERKVETLNRRELLEVSEKIIVEGSSLRQIYETHLIGERGLRRLVAEHLHGGDLKKALRREIVEREIDFERDPALRDMAPTGGPSSAGSSGPGSRATLDQMVAQAAAKVAGDSEEAAFYRARAAYEAREYQQKQRQRRAIDISLGTVIVILLGLVVYLALTRTSL